MKAMSNLYAWVDQKACQFPNIDPIVELDPISCGDLPMVSSINRGDTATVTINLKGTNGLKTNGEYYEDFLKHLKEEKVTKLTRMAGKFKIFVDAVVYDENRRVIEEGIKIHNIDSDDAIRILDVDSTNSCQYVKTKIFRTVVQYSYPVIRTGVIGERKAPRYIRIRGVSIMAEISKARNTNGIARLNQTLLDTTISPISPTIEQAKGCMVELFNSYGYRFGIIDLVNPPRAIDLSIAVILEGFTYPYNEKEIIDIIRENGGGKPTPPDPDPDPEEPECPCEPDEFFAEYVRCQANDPLAGKVISDEDFAAGNYTGRAYALSTVQKDIPNITIGEFVKYEETLVLTSM